MTPDWDVAHIWYAIKWNAEAAARKASPGAMWTRGLRTIRMAEGDSRSVSLLQVRQWGIWGAPP